MKISIITITYYTGEVLFKCLESCQKMINVKEIIILNNGNDQETIVRLQELANQTEQIKFFTGHGNIGFAKACNLGASFATGEYLLFLNPDCYTNDIAAAQKMAKALEMHPEYWLASCLILNSDNTIQKTCRRNILTPFTALTESLNFKKLGIPGLNLPSQEIEDLPLISSVPAISGAVMMIGKEKYYYLQGINEYYFMHVEDMDLCMRISQYEGKICFVKDAIISHALSTSETTNQFLEFHKARGFIYYLEAYFTYCNLPIIKQLLRSLIWLRYYLKCYLS